MDVGAGFAVAVFGEEAFGEQVGAVLVEGGVEGAGEFSREVAGEGGHGVVVVGEGDVPELALGFGAGAVSVGVVFLDGVVD